MGKKNNNILIVSPGYPRWKGDYTHPMVYNLARLLKTEGYKISVVTIHYPNTPVIEKMDNVEVVRAKYATQNHEVLGSDGGLIDDIRGSWKCKILVIPMLLSLAWHTFKKARYSDQILVQWVPTALVALPAKLFLRRKLILHSRTYPDTFFWKMVYRIIIPLADGIIYNSKDNRNFTEKLYKHPLTTVIGSGINVKQFQSFSKNKKISKTWELISVARLVEFKGLKYSIKAISLLKSRGRSVRLTIVGDGPLRNDLEKLAKQLNVTDSVVMVGAIPHEKIPQILSQKNLFLISSIVDNQGRTEGFGAVILEAMAAGLPVVASSVGGIVDIVNKNNGILVPEKNETAIADAVESILTNNKVAKNLSSQGLKFVNENFSDIAMVDSYNHFFNLLKTKNRR